VLAGPGEAVAVQGGLEQGRDAAVEGDQDQVVDVVDADARVAGDVASSGPLVGLGRAGRCRRPGREHRRALDAVAVAAYRTEKSLGLGVAPGRAPGGGRGPARLLVGQVDLPPTVEA